MKFALATAAVLAVVGVSTFFVPADRGASSPTTPTTTTLPASDTMDYRGVAIQVASGWYAARKRYAPLLDEIAGLGANAVLYCVPGHMEHATSQSIYLDVRKVPPPEDFKAIVRQARERDLRVVLMPIVLLQNPRGSEWRGVIEPPQWDQWWREYTDFILYFANIAREAEADALIVGSELVSTEKQTDHWRRLIAEVRKHFYGGQLGYSANWDHYRPVEFWDALDFIGMTSYYTLADDDNPSVAELVERWRPIREEVLAWRRAIGKPIVFTEVGWCSQSGAAQEPWNYYHDQRATPAGMEEQRRLYEAFIRTWSDTPGVMGTIWWEWTADAGGPGDYGYTPKNKPAEAVLRRWFGATSQPATSRSSPRP